MTFEERIGYAKCKYEYGGVSPDTVKEMIDALKEHFKGAIVSDYRTVMPPIESHKLKRVLNSLVKAEQELNTK